MELRAGKSKMKLSLWMKKNNISDNKLARLLGVGGPAVWKWRKGIRLPREDLMRKIFDITQESVTPNDFFMNRKTKEGAKSNEASVSEKE